MTNDKYKKGPKKETRSVHLDSSKGCNQVEVRGNTQFKRVHGFLFVAELADDLR